MSLPRVILLAAGQGSRLGPLAANRPKALMPVAGEPLILRTLRQFHEAGFQDITVVIGHMRDAMESALIGADNKPTIIINDHYATDTNIGSLLCGLQEYDTPALVFEADIACDTTAINKISQASTSNGSAWFSTGPFRHYPHGGCLRADEGGRLTDLRYVAKNGPAFADYMKLLGAVYVGPREMPRFHHLLKEAASLSTAQYYMMPWCEHLAELPAINCDLSDCKTATFNTPEEYQRCLAQFTTATI